MHWCVPRCTWAYTIHCGVPPTYNAAYTLYCGLPPSCTAMRFTPSCTTAYPPTPALRRTLPLHWEVPSDPCTAAYPPLALRYDLPPLVLPRAYPLLHCGVSSHPCIAAYPLLALGGTLRPLHCGLPPSCTAMRFILVQVHGVRPHVLFIRFSIFYFLFFSQECGYVPLHF